MENRTYIAIDLKSFYASVECIQRGLDPLTTNLVVADSSKTEKTICLAVTPSLKKFGLSGRSRLYDVIARVKQENNSRSKAINWKSFTGSSYDEEILAKNPYLKLDYIVASPRMAYYIEYSTKIYDIYLRYVSEEDMHVYSIDEVFIDATAYLKNRNMTGREFAKAIIKEVYECTGITATAGIGPNMYLCKIAMDIRAKHISADEDGVRIAELDELSYREHLWDYKPITDFWRIGWGYKERLSKLGLYTMGDVAKCSIGDANNFYNEKLLYKTFGVNAELLIDHAWGYEPVTMKEVRNYRPQNRSLSTGQVLSRPYKYREARVILIEMLDALSLDLVKKGLVVKHLTIMIGYDIENVDPDYQGELTLDMYGRTIPKHERGSINLDYMTSSSKHFIKKSLEWFESKVNRALTIRRFSISADNILDEKYEETDIDLQMNFLDFDLDRQVEKKERMKKELEKEKRLQRATLAIQEKYGKNALLKGFNFEEGATHIERNSTIGGHKA